MKHMKTQHGGIPSSYQSFADLSVAEHSLFIDGGSIDIASMESQKPKGRQSICHIQSERQKRFECKDRPLSECQRRK